MTPAEFLHLVWPATGHYILATPFTIPNTTKVTYAHHVYDTIDAAVVGAARLGKTSNVFFCVHSSREAKVWNSTKHNYKTDTPGAYEIRTQTNMLACKALFFDLDVGESTKVVPKYPTQRDAALGLKAFVAAAGLPAPMVVTSGGGLHVYWVLSEALASDEWVVLATKIKALAGHHGLSVDPARTTDTSSVLRVPGTFNRKDEKNLRPVVILNDQAAVTTPDDMTALLDAALIRAGISTVVPLARPKMLDSILGSNTMIEYGPKTSFPALVAACAQVHTVLTAKGDVDEPFWYAMLGLVRFCERGDEAAHYISRGHPSYDADDTDQKLHQLEAKQVGPTTCAKIEACNPGGCNTCPRKGVVKSPLSAARQTEAAEPPVVEAPAHIPDAIPSVVPDPPKPFIRLKTGAVGVEMGSKEDPEKLETVVILPYDFYPIRRMHDNARGEETHLWHATLPRVGATQILLDADTMYDAKKLLSALANSGVFPKDKDIPLLRNYMVAYINTLQVAADAEILHTNLGWSDDYNQFVLPSKVLHHDGTVTEANLNLAADRATTAIHTSGTLDQQVKLLKFFDHPSYTANQFSICAALGAPIFFATGHHGVVVNMSGPPGASKSTTLYTGASLWGDPLKFCINGTTSGATTKARDNRMAITSNLPQLVDEITRMQPRDAADLAMGVTQSESRIRLTSAGLEQKSIHSNKSTIMLCTANTSLYTILSAERADSTAESMRVFEMQYDLATVHQKYEADTYLADLKLNYGHVGEVFLSYVVQHREEVTTRVREIMRRIDMAANIEAGERFWSAAAAASLAACEIANKLNLLSFDVQHIWNWLLKHQIPAMRGTMTEQYSTPAGVLSEYMEAINGNMLVLYRGSIRNHENIPNIVRQPEHGQLLGRLEQDSGLMWVLKKPFKDYCVRHGHNFTRIIDDLLAQKVITKKHERKVLGGGTDYAKGQSWCFVVNMHHKEVSGKDAAPTPEARILTFPAASTTETVDAVKS